MDYYGSMAAFRKCYLKTTKPQMRCSGMKGGKQTEPTRTVVRLHIYTNLGILQNLSEYFVNNKSTADGSILNAEVTAYTKSREDSSASQTSTTSNPTKHRNSYPKPDAAQL